MKIKAGRPFKADYERIESRLKNPRPFRKAFAKALSILQQGNSLAEEYVVNPLVAQGQGWYDCYIYENIIMIYKVEGNYVKLSRLGTPKDLEKER